MNDLMNDQLQEQNVDAAFSKQSPIFDEIDDHNNLLLWMRDRVHREVLQYAPKGAYMLELNCGTGIDAMFFARNGYKIKATDNAKGMLQQLQQKIEKHNMEDRITAERCSFNNLEQLGTNPQFDYVFSNFGGLNCTDRLDKVLHDIDTLLKPGGSFTLVIMPRVCLWEMLMIFRGYFKTAFRRFRRGATKARVEGVYFDCYYYNPKYIIKHMGSNYSLQSLKGLAITVPPPYIEHFTERHPTLFKTLEKWENKIWSKSPFNRWGDHFMITMQKAG
ncbi:class I SAM-dependent methyltransferase [Chitinophagaceae bacterium MMS25-I14]